MPTQQNPPTIEVTATNRVAAELPIRPELGLLVDPSNRTHIDDAPKVFTVYNQAGGIALRFMTSNHSRNPESEEAKLQRGAFDDFAQHTSEQPRIALQEGRVRVAAWKNWQEARILRGDTGQLTHQAHSFDIQSICSDPEEKEKKDALFRAKAEGGYGYLPEIDDLFKGMLGVKAYLGMKAAGGLSEIENVAGYFAYAEAQGRNIPSYNLFEQLWTEQFPGVSASDSSWPDGTMRTAEDYGRLLFSLSTHIAERDKYLDGLGGEFIKTFEYDSRHVRDLYKANLFAFLAERDDSPALITAHGSLHLGGLQKVFEAIYPQERGFHHELLGSNACIAAFVD